MHILHETPLGYALLKESPLELIALDQYKDISEAVTYLEKSAEGEVPSSLSALLKKHKVTHLGVPNAKLADGLKKEAKEEDRKITIETGEHIEAIDREIHERVAELLNISEKELNRASLLLAHALCRDKLKMIPQKMDLVLVHCIKTLEKIDIDINKKTMRIREWYGMHFPELGEMISDNRKYLETVKKQLDGEEIDDESIKDAMERTIGGELSEEDKELLKENLELLLQMYETREKMHSHLVKRMQQIAPNLLEVVGEYIGAKLIAHSGSLLELAGKPASTIQVMGAEKVLFKALRDKTNPPKYGYIFNSTLVGQAPTEYKGQMARALAAKIALAARCDAACEEEKGTFGQETRKKMEQRLEALIARKKTSSKKTHTKPEKFSFKRSAPPSTLSAKRRS
ncbi:nucleolar protein 58 [Nematocida sp. LUAm3]|nr:nucleolar protein 58 [Nematocida sp. LUAm3]KAI5174114.1 nucleolar protein 58 [Nematocida sp. LUAm2]KAI5177143.1 nucleolar protein 58 [Nematocida sp. LUAm1]